MEQISQHVNITDLMTFQKTAYFLRRSKMEPMF
jgi:hypothetical protein